MAKAGRNDPLQQRRLLGKNPSSKRSQNTPFLITHFDFDRGLLIFAMVTLFHTAFVLNGIKKRLLGEPLAARATSLVFNYLFF